MEGKEFVIRTVAAAGIIAGSACGSERGAHNRSSNTPAASIEVFVPSEQLSARAHAFVVKEILKASLNSTVYKKTRPKESSKKENYFETLPIANDFELNSSWVERPAPLVNGYLYTGSFIGNSEAGVVSAGVYKGGCTIGVATQYTLEDQKLQKLTSPRESDLLIRSSLEKSLKLSKAEQIKLAHEQLNVPLGFGEDKWIAKTIILQDSSKVAGFSLTFEQRGVKVIIATAENGQLYYHREKLPAAP